MCRLLECHTFIFGRHFRGTILLNWFFRALVRGCSLQACGPALCHGLLALPVVCIERSQAVAGMQPIADAAAAAVHECLAIGLSHNTCLMPSTDAQGGNVADSAFIDSIDVMDLDFLTIGPEAVVSEGTIVTCHTFKDGFITFERVRLPCWQQHALPCGCVCISMVPAPAIRPVSPAACGLLCPA